RLGGLRRGGRERPRAREGGRRLRLPLRRRGRRGSGARGLPRLPHMIDLRAARNDPETFRAALARKGAAEVFDELLEADRGVREIQPRVEELRATRKVKGKPTPEQLEELERVKTELHSLEQQLAAAEGRRKELLDRVPNPPDEATPDGETDDDAVEIRRWGDPRSFDFPVKDHLELAAPGIDLERGAKVSGSRFAFRSGDVALLELALYRFALDRLT